ncbi:hypothetical protein BBJ29_001829 [Phytophthora kernoviae]|uniref:Uncharacterized protein n=1 Tax=Phytophthora kernoviae TaxID=325452 RepID=A0A3F2RR92_9STRA|nr:hypothetical protein BBJ29_001829 [Phytophthora kernoviae]RLN62630.1 hypothetical protein BBP00_00004637 [Phytophthora kernoviae]
MGFNIPNSPRGQCDAAVQWTGTAEPTLTPSGAVLGEGFRQSLVARRRNAIVPGSLSFDVLGSPRSPHVFLTQEHRRFLAQSQDHGQQTTSSHAAGTKAASGMYRHADRLALFIQRYTIAEDRVAHQLNWTVEKLRVYLSPEARRLKAASDIVDTAVDKLLMKYRVALAHKTLMTASSKPLTPIEASLRRSSAASNTVKDDGSSATDADSSTDQLDVRKPRRVSAAELICPIRLDVDLDGVRFQDTFLLNAANPGCSPEAIAAQIAHDEKMSEKLKDAIAESIRRQILTLTSCVSTEQKPERLYPIYLDLIINGFSLRDQFEWDITNDFTAAQKFASTLCADLKLSAPFETAIIFSIYEQVAAYRTALSGGKWIGNNPFHEKEYYTQLTEVENEKRRRDHVLDMRDRAIAEWEEEESRRKGLLASSTLEASAEHFRGLLLENYMSERNEVDANRAESGGNTGEDDEFDEDHES